MRLLGLTIVAGCGFSASTGVTSEDAAPDGVVIDTAVIDAPTDAPIDAPIIDDTDDDDDGVLDIADNCPLTANPDQHNEDSDPRGDRCDPCPQSANADTDTDGDQIGDACDPHPATGGDVLVVFDGFPGNLALPTGWTQIGGSNGDWGVSGDALRLDTNDVAHLLRFNAGGGHTTIDLLIDASQPGPNVPSMTAIVDGDAALTTFSACSALVTEQSRRLQTFANGSFMASAESPGTVSVPGRHRLIAKIDGGGFACTFSPGGGLAANFTANNRTGVGVRIRNLRVAINYVAIYRSP